MTGMFMATHMLAVIVASSYVTLAVFSTDDAERLAGPYGLVMLVLTIANLAAYRRVRRG